MNIDMKRLETSREYWDEIAPEGAEVYRGYGLFSKWVDGIEQVYDTAVDGAEDWFESPIPWSKDMYDRDEGVVFRPDPTAEWNGEGLPPVGCECEYRPDPKVHDGWERCTYLAHHDKEHFVLAAETGEVDRMLDTLSPSFRFRPIRTKADRQRDDLINVMGKAEIRGCMTRTDFENIADAILAANFTKPETD